MFEECDVVRIVKLITPNRRFDGTAGVIEPPKIGDVGTIVHIVEQTNPADTIYIIEKVAPSGETIWLADFQEKEIELLDD